MPENTITVEITPDEQEALQLIGSLGMSGVFTELQGMYGQDKAAQTIVNYAKFLQKTKV